MLYGRRGMTFYGVHLADVDFTQTDDLMIELLRSLSCLDYWLDMSLPIYYLLGLMIHLQHEDYGHIVQL